MLNVNYGYENGKLLSKILPGIFLQEWEGQRYFWLLGYAKKLEIWIVIGGSIANKMRKLLSFAVAQKLTN